MVSLDVCSILVNVECTVGPYIPDWGCCSAPWHPSIKGHQLRAGHQVHVILWLFIMHDAVSELHHRVALHPDAPSSLLLSNVTTHLGNIYSRALPLGPPLHKSEFVDGIQW